MWTTRSRLESQSCAAAVLTLSCPAILPGRRDSSTAPSQKPARPPRNLEHRYISTNHLVTELPSPPDNHLLPSLTATPGRPTPRAQSSRPANRIPPAARQGSQSASRRQSPLGCRRQNCPPIQTLLARHELGSRPHRVAPENQLAAHPGLGRRQGGLRARQPRPAGAHEPARAAGRRPHPAAAARRDGARPRQPELDRPPAA